MNDKEMVRKSIRSVRSNFCEAPLNSTDCYLLTFYLAGIWEKLCIRSRNKETRSESLEVSERKNRHGKTNAFKTIVVVIIGVTEAAKTSHHDSAKEHGSQREAVTPGAGLLLAPQPVQ